MVIYPGNALFRDNLVALFIEIVLYISILVVYFLALRNPRQELLVLFAHIISYVGLVTVILIISFVAYFAATFRW